MVGISSNFGINLQAYKIAKNQAQKTNTLNFGAKLFRDEAESAGNTTNPLRALGYNPPPTTKAPDVNGNYASNNTEPMKREKARLGYNPAPTTKAPDVNTTVGKTGTKKLEDEACEAFGKKEYSKCIELLTQALKQNPKSARAWHIMGSAYAQLGEYEIAIHSYSNAIELSPNSSNSLKQRGNNKLNYAKSIESKFPIRYKEVLRSANRDYGKSLAIKDDPNIYENKAEVLIRLKENKQAIEALDKCIENYEAKLEKEPDNKKIQTKLASAHHRKGVCIFATAKNAHSKVNYEALEEFNKALELLPNSANTYYERAKVLQLIDLDAAKEDLKKAIELAPNRARYYELYGNILAVSKNQDERQDGFGYKAEAMALRGSNKE